MISLLDQYDGNSNYRKFLLEISNQSLDDEVDNDGKLVDNVISKILDKLNIKIYQAELNENKIQLKFLIFQTDSTVSDLQNSVRSLGNSVGSNSCDLSQIILIEL